MAKGQQDIPEEAFEPGGERLLQESADVPASKTRLKYKGAPPYGVEFLTTHTLTKDDVRNVLERQGMDEDDIKEAVRGYKEVVWGRHNGWTADVSDMHPDMVEYLKSDPAWTQVD